MLAIYILIVSLNFWAINCDETCDCEEIGVLKKVLQNEMLDRKMESARTIIKVEELLSSYNCAAMIHGGIGAAHFNSILSTLGLPAVSPKTLKRRERAIGPVIELVAKKSCMDFSKQERNLTSNEISETGDHDTQITFDQALAFLKNDCEENENHSDDSQDQVTAIETKIADIYVKLNELSKERHVEKTIAIVEKALTSEKEEWIEFMSETEKQISHIADTVLKLETMVNKTECFSGKAKNHKTTRRTTISGFQCQRWDSQTPHEHEYKEDQFPEDCSFCQAENYCRDPGDDGFLWCYTTDPEKRWEGCGIPWCEEPERNDNTHDCYIIPNEDRQSGRSDKELCERKVNRFEVNVTTGYDPGCTNCESCCQVKDCHPASCPHCYTGTWHRAESGRECQRWDAQFPHKHDNNVLKKFRLDRSVSAAQNYCRDPTKSGFLWCYTMDPNERWEKCGMQEC